MRNAKYNYRLTALGHEKTGLDPLVTGDDFTVRVIYGPRSSPLLGIDPPKKGEQQQRRFTVYVEFGFIGSLTEV